MKTNQAHIATMANRFEKNQLEALKSAWQDSDHLTKEKKIELVVSTGLDVEQIASWFSRKRARKRAREGIAELEQAHTQLQQALKQSRGNEAELEKELEDSKKREMEVHDENQRLKQRISLAQGDRQLGTLMRVVNGYYM